MGARALAALPEDRDRFNRRFDRLIDDFRKADTVGGEPFRLVGAFWRTGGAMRSLLPRGGLWRHSDFLKLWTGGDQPVRLGRPRGWRSRSSRS